MSPWLEAFGVVALAIIGAWLGWRSSRLPCRYWMLGYFIPLSLILLFTLATRKPALGFIPPVSWLEHLHK